MFYKIKKYFRNLIRYHDILKEDEDYDYEYLYDIILKKLKLMENFYVKEKNEYNTHEKTIYELSQCISILERIVEDDYYPEDGNTYIETLSPIDFSSNGDKKPMSEGIRKKIIRWDIEEEENRQKDMKTFFELLNKNIRNWWY